MDESPPPVNKKLKIRQIILIAIIAIAFTALWLETYLFLQDLLWMNNFVLANRWTIPAGIIFFSLLVGLCQKYLRAPNVISGGFAESLQGEGSDDDYRIFPGTLLTSFFSLFSGASIGPEGSIAFLIKQISAFVREKLAISKDSALGFDMAALASAYNGVLGSPLFTAALATEFNIGKKDAPTFLAWNLIAGVIGFLFYIMLGLQSFASFLPFPSIHEITIVYILHAIVLGILGAGVAIFMGLAMNGIGKAVDKAFGDNSITRILGAGCIMAVVCYLLPDLMFSGETSIHAIIKNSAQIGIMMLLLMAFLKIVLLALSFKSGYLGGPIFPTIFICTMIGLALGLVFPGVPVGIFVLCILAAVITIALGTPLTAILLVVVVGATTQAMIVLFVISSAVALLIGIALKPLRGNRAAKEAEVPQ